MEGGMGKNKKYLLVGGLQQEGGRTKAKSKSEA